MPAQAAVLRGAEAELEAKVVVQVAQAVEAELEANVVVQVEEEVVQVVEEVKEVGEMVHHPAAKEAEAKAEAGAEAEAKESLTPPVSVSRRLCLLGLCTWPLLDM